MRTPAEENPEHEAISRVVPPWKTALRAALDGFSGCLRMARAALANPAERTLFLRVVLWQVVVTVLLAGAVGVPLVLVARQMLTQGGANIEYGEKGIVIHGGDGVRSAPEASLLLVIFGLAYLAYGLLVVAEAIVIALSREHHDQIGRRRALAAGLEPEDPDEVPRVRLNLRWLRTKSRRKRRAMRLFLVGLPLLLLVRFSPFGDGFGAALYTVVIAGWSFYWLTVFVGAKSKFAWVDDETAPAWAPLRKWTEARERTALLRWWLPDAYLWLLKKATHDVRAPCKRLEEAEYELVGLALARAVFGLPVVYLFFRPFFPVVANAIVTCAAARTPAQTEPTLTP